MDTTEYPLCSLRALSPLNKHFGSKQPMMAVEIYGHKFVVLGLECNEL